MPESYDTAMRRLRSMERSKNDNLKREYCEQINNLKMGTQSQRRINLHPNACGTAISPSRIRRRRIRLVFDAAPVQATYRRSVSADIKEMFLRVGSEKEDSSRWRNNIRKSTRVPNDVTDFRRRLIACTAIYIKIATPQNLNLSTRRRAKRYD
ncbi:hypothetical protein EVAR_28021_1 [Eumeta japonica]|uniref:Uncharacterized protein n=1 Tax=Eumeta variegata TaxID=151549 RepID=A0A4C1WET1_EUMVA|nr:hypothetical protein EVAR_28021_1 [Eumeta japonica]